MNSINNPSMTLVALEDMRMILVDQVTRRSYQRFRQLQNESTHSNNLQNFLVQSRYQNLLDEEGEGLPVELELPDEEKADLRILNNLVKVVLQFENTYLAALIGAHTEEKLCEIMQNSKYPSFSHFCKASWNNIALAILTKPNLLDLQSRSQYSHLCELMRKEIQDILRQFLAVMPLLDF